MNQFVLRQSIWEQTEDLTKFGLERNIIKRVVGESLVDETLDLHNELRTLHEIWQEYHQLDQNKDCSSLFDPPFAKENVKKHICLLVELIQEKVNGGSSSFRSLSNVLSEREQSFVDQALEDRKDNKIISSSPCFESTNHLLERSSSSLSTQVEILEDKLNALGIDDVVQSLRNDLQDEKENLLKDINFIQERLITNNQDEDVMKSSNLKDLTEIKSKLEKEVLQEEVFSTKPLDVNSNIEAAFLSDHLIKMKYSPSPPSTANTKHSPEKVPLHRKYKALSNYKRNMKDLNSSSMEMVGEKLIKSPSRKTCQPIK